jgi:ABC-type phosphate transport system permease subunit
VIGVLSALPIISAGNLCCCMWIISGGFLAAYLLQQDSPTPITQSDGAIVGLLAGIVGAGAYLVISIPITVLFAPMQHRMLQSFMDRAENMPPEFRHYMTSYVGGVIGLIFGFVFMLILGVIFSTIGGLLGAVFFRKPVPPTADSSSSS